MKQTIEILIKRWLNNLESVEDLKSKDSIKVLINKVKKEMRYALKVIEEKEGNKENENN